MLAYTGIETISNMSEEAKDPGRTVPKAINRVVIAVFAIYALLPAIALSALPVRCVGNHCQTLLGVDDQHGGYAGDPVLGVVRALHLGPLQHAAEIYVGLLAATILFIATNAGILGVSRLTYSMGIHRQVPDRLRRLHPKFGTPWVGIIIFSTIAAITLIPGQATFLGNLYAFGAMLSFTIAHLAVTRMRVTLPNVERPYRPPGNLRLAGQRSAAVRDRRRLLHVRVAVGAGRAPHQRGDRRDRLAGRRDDRLPGLPPPPWSRPHHDHEGRDPAAGDRDRGRVRVACSWPSTTATTCPR